MGDSEQNLSDLLATFSSPVAETKLSSLGIIFNAMLLYSKSNYFRFVWWSKITCLCNLSVRFSAICSRGWITCFLLYWPWCLQRLRMSRGTSCIMDDVDVYFTRSHFHSADFRTSRFCSWIILMQKHPLWITQSSRFIHWHVNPFDQEWSSVQHAPKESRRVAMFHPQKRRDW
jgi:hypothetical protein